LLPGNKAGATSISPSAEAYLAAIKIALERSPKIFSGIPQSSTQTCERELSFAFGAQQQSADFLVLSLNNYFPKAHKRIP